VSAQILIVEDDALSRKMLCDLLAAVGYGTRSAGTAEAGLRIAAEQTVNLILMDVRLPDMSGFAALKRIRAIDATVRTPVIAVTASAMRGDRESILAAGFHGFHPKPIQIPSLLQEIARLLEKVNP
jgi:two-component system, cell cycle response regulator DivK